MTGFFGGISNFFARHRAHCSEHEVYESDCVAANRSSYVDPRTDVMTDTGGSRFFFGDASGGDTTSDTSSMADSSSTGDSCSPTDSSPGMDSCPVDTSTSDFSGFSGGDSGGGGSSGDF